MERKEGIRMVNNAQPLDTIIVMKASWVLGNPKATLSLLNILKEKEISLYCIDLEGNISVPTQTKLIRSQGISALICSEERIALAIAFLLVFTGSVISSGTLNVCNIES